MIRKDDAVARSDKDIILHVEKKNFRGNASKVTIKSITPPTTALGVAPDKTSSYKEHGKGEESKSTIEVAVATMENSNAKKSDEEKEKSAVLSNVNSEVVNYSVRLNLGLRDVDQRWRGEFSLRVWLRFSDSLFF